MTLGEFREQTKELSDDLVLEFYSERYNDSTQPIRLDFDTGGYIEFIIDDDGWYLKQEPKWIPCSERLPKKSGLYLVSIDDFATSAIFIEDVFMINGHIITPDAWALLPKSYKAEREKK